MKYKHHKNGKVYKFIALVYSKEYGSWRKNKVLYKRNDNLFIRDKDEFFEKFERVEQ